MAYKEVHRVEISEVIRRWQAGNSQRSKATGTGLSRETVRRCTPAYAGAGSGGRPGSRGGPGRASRHCRPAQRVGVGEPLGAAGAGSAQRGEAGSLVGPDLSVAHPGQAAVHQDPGVAGGAGLPNLLFLPALVAKPAPLAATPQRQHGADGGGRPGEVAELDFGRLGCIQDPETDRRCAVWALLVVLVHSRHSFLWPSYSQKLEEVIAGLEAAWAFFGGIPKYLVIDNFPVAVAGADSLHPRLTRGFLEYSQHRGFITDPARVRHPRDKPKVERGVQYVRERFFKGGDFKDLTHLRSEAARWCRDVAGRRIHGATRRQPRQVFLDEERPALNPWDGEPYEVTHWRSAKVHPDHHVAGQYALYSAPSTLCPPGQQVEIGLGLKLVRIYHRGRLVKVHSRQPRGGRATDAPDYPAELSAYTLRAPDGIKRSAAEQGPAVAEFAERLFDCPLPWAKVRQGHKLIRLGQRYTPERLDSACRRTLEVDLIDVRRVERILLQALEQAEPPEHPLHCPQDASPAQARSSPMLKASALSQPNPPSQPNWEQEVNHDPRHRTHPSAQAAPARTHGRHPARAHRPGP